MNDGRVPCYFDPSERLDPNHQATMQLGWGWATLNGVRPSGHHVGAGSDFYGRQLVQTFACRSHVDQWRNGTLGQSDLFGPEDAPPFA